MVVCIILSGNYYIISKLLHYRSFVLHYRTVITLSGDHYILGWYRQIYDLTGSAWRIIMPPCFSVNTLNWIRCVIGSRCNSRSAVDMCVHASAARDFKEVHGLLEM